MARWKSLHIERFRRLENLRLEGLGSVNLLVGRNNSGKTSVLEALAVASSPTSALNWINTARERELRSARTPVLQSLNWMFPHTSPRQNGYEGSVAISVAMDPLHHGQRSLFEPDSIRFEADYREFREVPLQPAELPAGDSTAEEAAGYVGRLTVRLSKSGNGPQEPLEEVVHEFRGEKFVAERERPPILPHQFVSPVSHRTNQQLLSAVDRVLEERRKPEVIRLLRRFASDVDDIEIRSPEWWRAVVYVHHEGLGHVPLAVEGDGMRRALAFASAATLARGGVLLLDEVETALHPEALAGMFRFLVEVCRETDVQLFVTTHSLEAVDAMLGSVDEGLDLVGFRLPARDSGVPLKRFDGQTLHDLRHEGGLDIR